MTVLALALRYTETGHLIEASNDAQRTSVPGCPFFPCDACIGMRELHQKAIEKGKSSGNNET